MMAEKKSESREQGIVDAVRVGSAATVPSGAMVLTEASGTVALEPAPMPQFQMAADAGLEPVIPAGLAEIMILDEDSTAIGIRHAAEEFHQRREEKKRGGPGAGPGGPAPAKKAPAAKQAPPAKRVP